MPTRHPNLIGLEPGEIQAALAPLGPPAYAGRQVFRWLHGRRVLDFAAMTDLPLVLRGRLAESFEPRLPEVEERVQASDATVRYGYRLDDGERTESVRIPGRDGQVTLCLSSQVGCPLACTFCVSGLGGVRRNLSSAEIVGQALVMLGDAGPTRRVNLVFMGMGEALLNFDQVALAWRVLAHDDGPAIPWRRMTVSTAGHVPAIDRLSGMWPRPRLAVSLNAASDELRERIMPINRAWPLQALLSACRRFALRPAERITFEYVLLGGVNDSDAEARRLPGLLAGIPAKVNLIPWNPAPGFAFQSPDRARVDRFSAILHQRGLRVTVRERRGAEAGAACGQLALERAAGAGAR